MMKTINTGRSARTLLTLLALTVNAHSFSTADQAVSAPSDRSGSAESLLELCVILHQTGERQTLLQVYADGRIFAAAPSGRGQLVEDRITPKAADKLAHDVRRVLTDSGVSTQALNKELANEAVRTGLGVEVLDADETLLEVCCDGVQSEIRCPAIGVLSQRFPGAGKLQALTTVNERLLNVSAIVQAGGHAAAERLATAASRQLSAEHPGVKAWTVDELMMVRARDDGSRYIQFRRCQRENSSTADEVWMTSIFESPGQQMRVSVTPPESVIR